MKAEIVALLKIVNRLQQKYPKRKFTLDGRLVGDIGEILVEQAYNLTLYDTQVPRYDAETPDGRKVQIKATMKKSLTFPVYSTPDYYIGVRITETGELEEIFNGPGDIIRDKLLRNRTKPRGVSTHAFSISKLRELSARIPASDRIEKR